MLKVPAYAAMLFMAVGCSDGGPTGDRQSTTPTAVVIAPLTATVVSGATQQFTAVAQNASGQTVPATIVYSSSGGTVTSAGVYTAGGTPGTYTVTGTVEGTAVAGSATVTVTAPPPDLTPASVILTPANATLLPGATQQFTASVRNAANQVLGNPVTFGATGGTISAGGLYTAGATPGSYQVTVTVNGTAISDSSPVTISTPPPAGSFTPNEPAGMTRLREFSFSDGTDFFGGDFGSTAGFSFPSAPFSPPGVARFVFPAGPAAGFYTGGAYPPNLPAGTVKVYIAYNWRFSPGFTLHPGNLKGWYFYRQTEQTSGSLVVGWDRTGGTLSTGTFELNGQPQTAGGPGRMGHNTAGAPTLARDQWYHTEILAVMNTSTGASDGILRVWVNGVLTVNFSNVRFSEGGQPLQWRELHLDPYYGGETPGHTIPSTQYLYVDHAIISTSTVR